MLSIKPYKADRFQIMIRQIALLIFFIGLFDNLYSQEYQIRITNLSDSIINNSGASKLIFTNNLDEAKKLALEDIKNSIPFLLINGGGAPSVSKDQIDFEKEFNIYYYRFGCNAPNDKVEEVYIFAILDYVNKIYGKICIDKISKDVFGFKKWKKDK